MAAVLRKLTFVLGLIATALGAAAGGPAWGDTIEVQTVELEAGDDRVVLNVEFGFELTSRMEEALNNGVSLNFLVEFELTRPRWYWLDEKTAAEKRELRLSYYPLAQQYRLSNGSQHQSFATLAEALRALGRVRGWQVLQRERLSNGQNYVAAVRMRLDTAQLPTPFRVSAVTNREWTLASEWKRFPFTPLAPVREAK